MVAINPSKAKREADTYTLSDEHIEIMLFLYRAGVATSRLVHQHCFPDESFQRVCGWIGRLTLTGLVVSHSGISPSTSRGRAITFHELTRAGNHALQETEVGECDYWNPDRLYDPFDFTSGSAALREFRGLSWGIQMLHHLGGESLIDDVWTTRRRGGAIVAPPALASGETLNAKHLTVAGRGTITGLHGGPFERVVPSLRMRLALAYRGQPADVEVLVRYLPRVDPVKMVAEFRRYDAFLTGWSPTVSPFREMRRRPVVVWVLSGWAEVLECAAIADAYMIGSIGRAGSEACDRDFVGRRHSFFASEADIYEGSGRVLGLPILPQYADASRLRRVGRGAGVRDPCARCSIAPSSAKPLEKHGIKWISHFRAHGSNVRNPCT